MRHVFRVNVAGQGHALYLCDGDRAPLELPLDVRSDVLPPDFTDAQGVVDDLLSEQPGGPYLYASGTPGGGSFVLYGLLVDGHDEYGREGITLLHGLIDDEVDVVDLVQRVAGVVSVGSLGRVARVVRRMAERGADVRELLDAVEGAEGKGSWRLPTRHGAPPSPVAALVHDCSGSAVAWLAMARSNQGTDRPWAIWDAVAERGRVATLSSRGGPVLLLSDYLRAAVLAVDDSLGVAALLARTASPALPPPGEVDADRGAGTRGATARTTTASTAVERTGGTSGSATSSKGARRPAATVAEPDPRVARALVVRVVWLDTEPGRLVLYGGDRWYVVRPRELKAVVRLEDRCLLEAEQPFPLRLFLKRTRAFLVLTEGGEARALAEWIDSRR
ncbi:hypothetical protein [Saccharothrix sp. Mg75]|uniref:hypothetical protein n=1 Tax=Saccharothrix sp. Mg75 TaxID=3445357 RepID=UPI003EED7A0A